jgi:anti-sigma regulatory factor (Ser/Thr protein kinase)
MCSECQEALTSSYELELPRTREAPWLARRQLVEWTSAELNAGDLADATLLASELVANALAHGHGRIELHAELDENRLRVEVIDEGKGFERIARKRDFEQLGGWGLHIVDAVASRWGIHEGSSHVWFELERPGPRIGASDKPATDS